MKNLSGCLTAKLAETDERYELQLIDEINRRIKPPRPVGPGDVHIRAMYIVSDQVNSQGGCFAEEELERLALLLIDSPVMVGHQRDSLPLARNFMAQKVEIDGRIWVKSYFYWIKDSEGAEDLKNNIDGGIYKECSISFLFTLPECSICGHDIRECHHVPFREYEIEPGRRAIAHFKYRNIEKVLETSLVFRGAVPETRITDDLAPEPVDNVGPGRAMTATHFFKVAETIDGDPKRHGYSRASLTFGSASEFKLAPSIAFIYLAPYQPGICLRITKQNHEIEIEATPALPDSGRQVLLRRLSEIKADSFTVDALLYAVKGRQRLDGMGLMPVLASEGYRHRLRLKFCDVLEIDGDENVGRTYGERLDRLQSLFGDIDQTNFEIRGVSRYARDEWNPAAAVDGGVQYNFGVEIITENINGELTRHILTERKLTPAIISNVKKHLRGQIEYELRLLDVHGKTPSVVHASALKLAKGALVLLSPRPRAGRKRRMEWVLVDALLGTEAHQISMPPAGNEVDPGELRVLRNGNQLGLYFQEGEEWQSATVHHFSERLFRRRRRFITDIVAVKESIETGSADEIISLKSIARSGGMILLRPAKSSAAFGSAMGLWLRPILIDGEERFLFHADDEGQAMTGMNSVDAG